MSPKRARNSSDGRKQIDDRPRQGLSHLGDLSQRKIRSALSNGSDLILEGVDKRLAWSKRLRDLQGDITSDLGGEDNLSCAERVLIKRASFLNLQLEMMEACYVEHQDGIATSRQLHDYNRSCNTVRKLYGHCCWERVCAGVLVTSRRACLSTSPPNIATKRTTSTTPSSRSSNS